MKRCVSRKDTQACSSFHKNTFCGLWRFFSASWGLKRRQVFHKLKHYIFTILKKAQRWDWGLKSFSRSQNPRTVELHSAMLHHPHSFCSVGNQGIERWWSTKAKTKLSFTHRGFCKPLEIKGQSYKVNSFKGKALKLSGTVPLKQLSNQPFLLMGTQSCSFTHKLENSSHSSQVNKPRLETTWASCFNHW